MGTNGTDKKRYREGTSLWNKIQSFNKSADFQCTDVKCDSRSYMISYFKTLVDPNVLQRDILPWLNEDSITSINQLFDVIPVGDKKISSDWKEIKEKLMRGNVSIQFAKEDECLLVGASESKGRSVTSPQVETSVVGPKDAFVESIDVNLNLLRKRIPHPDLSIEEMQISEFSKVRVAICYIEGVTNGEYIQTITQRLKDIDSDFITDSTQLSQIVQDNTLSFFPQLVETERPDRVAALLLYGQLAVIVDGSSNVILGPANLGSFFIAYEDYYLPWNLASFFRVIRIMAVIFSVLSTPLYVAILTYHHQIIPNNLLVTIISSRIHIPFSPFIEVMIMELTIELLREASARLPQKVGQTIGIVGGIVIGTASVQASLTSNILLIIVALSALASFTTPVYRMANTIRILRYPFIFSAYVGGVLGIFICGMFILTHLLRLKSLGVPYMVPFYPPRTADFYDFFFRLPYSSFHHRFSWLRTKNPVAFDGGDAKKKKDKVKKDIDE